MHTIKRWMSKLWSLLSTLGTFWTLFQWVGWGPAVAAFIGMLVTTIGATFEGLPYTVTAVLALSAFALIILIAVVPKIVRAIASSAPADRPAYEAWDDVKELMLFQAACLWVEREPANPMPMGEAYARFSMLKEAARNRELPVVQDVGSALGSAFKAARGEKVHANATTFVSREALKAYAEKRGLRPRFLFPNDSARP